jgi:ribosomal protein L11 methyltransferase
VGTGAGVLARIARARGATFVVGTDIDPVALSSARAHSDLDAHPIDIHLGLEAPDHWGARFDLVVANILESPLRHLAPALTRALLPGGVLLLSGFTRMQTPSLRLVFESALLKFARQSYLDEWALLMFVQGESSRSDSIDQAVNPRAK